jgi:hypothetical protein
MGRALFIFKVKLLAISIPLSSNIGLLWLIIVQKLYTIKFFCFHSLPRDIPEDYFFGAIDLSKLSLLERIQYRHVLAQLAAIATCKHIFDLYEDGDDE